MATRSLQALSRDTDQKLITNNIPYANPTATFADLKAFVQGCLSLTENTYIDAYCVDKTSLNDATA